MFMSFQVSFVERKIHFCSRLYDLSFKVYFVSSSTQKEGRECSAPKAAPPKREVLQFGAILTCFSSSFQFTFISSHKGGAPAPPQGSGGTQHHTKGRERKAAQPKRRREKQHQPQRKKANATTTLVYLTLLQVLLCCVVCVEGACSCVEGVWCMGVVCGVCGLWVTLKKPTSVDPTRLCVSIQYISECTGNTPTCI